MQPYLVGGNQYKVDGETRERQKDALSFLKDWTTSFLTLQTALLTLVGGVLIGMKELSLSLSLLDAAILLGAVLLFVLSITDGMWLLHQFPAAAQRVPDNDPAKQEDIYKIGVNSNADTIEKPAVRFRSRFLWGIRLLAAFIVWRVLCFIIVTYVGKVLPEYLCNLPPHATP
jgi:hypothetical protein